MKKFYASGTVALSNPDKRTAEWLLRDTLKETQEKMINLFEQEFIKQLAKEDLNSVSIENEIKSLKDVINALEEKNTALEFEIYELSEQLSSKEIRKDELTEYLEDQLELLNKKSNGQQHRFDQIRDSFKTIEKLIIDMSISFDEYGLEPTTVTNKSGVEIKDKYVNEMKSIFKSSKQIFAEESSIDYSIKELNEDEEC